MTEYVATRWYRAPEVMLCTLSKAASASHGFVCRMREPDLAQRSRSIRRQLTCGRSGVSSLK
jgi:hypothetical protein